MSAWSGRKVPRLVRLTLHTKGRVCWLCGLPGADSADHNPPRSVLVRRGVPDPDALVYLQPAHLVCNQRRRTRKVTPALRIELRTRRLADLGMTQASAPRSARFAQPPAVFPHEPAPAGRTPSPYISGDAEKTRPDPEVEK